MKQPDNDWRMDDFVTLAKDWRSPWSGQLVPKGSQITKVSVAQITKKKVVSITLPNATALFLSASRRSWESARSIRERSKIDRSIKTEVAFNTTSESFDYLEQVMGSVVMAFTALEAFVNELIPDDFVYHTHKRSEIVIERMKKPEIERFLSLDEKLSKVLPEVLNVESPKGTKCWKGFVKLKRVRDRIIHMKKDDRRSSGPDIPTLWHELFRVEPPFGQAKDICDFFVRKLSVAPRWVDEYPSK